MFVNQISRTTPCQSGFLRTAFKWFFNSVYLSFWLRSWLFVLVQLPALQLAQKIITVLTTNFKQILNKIKSKFQWNWHRCYCCWSCCFCCCFCCCRSLNYHKNNSKNDSKNRSSSRSSSSSNSSICVNFIEILI